MKAIRQYFTLMIALALLVVAPLGASGQPGGDPVKRDRLVKVLRSKRFQTRDIVQIIRENGVDFRLNSEIQNELVAAGARPPILDAVKSNYRGGAASNSAKASSTVGTKGAPRNTYNGLIDQAVEAYDVRKDLKATSDLLNRAVAMQPSNPRGHQFLGFLNLYGYKNFNEAERHWKKAISLGGSAVLRVIHDRGSGTFAASNQGSLYIAKNNVRFESDDNKATFETSDSNIKKIDVNSKLKRLFQFKGGSFKIELEKEDKTTNYNFAPLSGKTDESKMIIRLIGK